MAKASNPKRYRFYGFNIKYQNDTAGPDTYYSLFTRMFQEGTTVSIGQDRQIQLRTQFNASANEGTVRILYGKLVRFNVISGQNWYDRTAKDFVNQEIPLGIYPNPVEADYIFVPEVHKFFVGTSIRLAPLKIREFLQKGLTRVVGSEEGIFVELMQSQDIFDRILKADLITRIEVNISYTNDDIGKEAEEFMDGMLKDGNVGSMTAVFRPDQSKGLNPLNPLVRGSLELAKDNGDAEASIIENGKKQKIVTKDHAELIVVFSENEQSVKVKLAQQIFSKYRRLDNPEDEKNGNE